MQAFGAAKITIENDIKKFEAELAGHMVGAAFVLAEWTMKRLQDNKTEQEIFFNSIVPIFKKYLSEISKSPFLDAHFRATKMYVRRRYPDQSRRVALLGEFAPSSDMPPPPPKCPAIYNGKGPLQPPSAKSAVASGVKINGDSKQSGSLPKLTAL